MQLKELHNFIGNNLNFTKMLTYLQRQFTFHRPMNNTNVGKDTYVDKIAVPIKKNGHSYL
jgi:hypothetical protein